MKTYKTTIEKPSLVIEYDSDSETPRKWDNLGYFYTLEGKYRSPDSNSSAIYKIMVDTAEYTHNTEEHIEHMTKLINKETDEKVMAIYPVNRYEHGNIYYSLGVKHGFDSSNCGFYIITDKTQKLNGTPKDKFIDKINSELDTYNKWVNGEVYHFTLYDKDGEVEDSCGGFYSLQEILEAMDITDEERKEWEKEDLVQYLV